MPRKQKELKHLKRSVDYDADDIRSGASNSRRGANWNRIVFSGTDCCLEYRDALVHQSVHTHNWLRSKTNKFDGFCEVRLIPSSEAGKGKYIFRDPVRKKEDE